MPLEPLPAGPLGIDWSERLHEETRWDPYLVWADATGFKLLGGNTAALGKGDRLPVLLRLHQHQGNWVVPEGVDLLPAYRGWGASKRATFSHVVGTVAVDRLAALASEVGSLQVSLPRRIAGMPQQPDARLLCSRRLIASPGPAVAPAAPASGARLSQTGRTVIGVIDDGFAFANRHFLDEAGQTRVLRLWQQDVCHGPEMIGWRLPAGWYGRELGREAIDDLRARYGRDEVGLYRGIGYLHPTARSYHGTHVLDLAAGWPDPLQRLRTRHAARGEANAAERGKRDAAASADLVLVQLPTLTSLDTSGASLAGFVLDAIHYILQQAAGAKVVINLSYGAHAGPHDGSSFLESAMQELLTAVNRTPLPGTSRRRLDIVVPAGNAHESCCHASATIGRLDSTRLHWQILPDDPTDSFLEIWLPNGGELAITVTPPGGRRTEPIHVGSAWVDGEGERRRFAVIYPRRCALGGAESGSMALIAVAPTRLRGTGPMAPHGIWEIGLRAVDQPVDFHAWIERDDAVFGAHHGGRQSRFVRGATAERTLNSIGTLEADGFWVVGGLRRSDGELARYSGAGTNRDPRRRAFGPDRVTWCEESRCLQGLPAAGSLGMSVVRMNGTSVAAPLVARQLAGGELDLPAAPAPPLPPQPGRSRFKPADASLRGHGRVFIP